MPRQSVPNDIKRYQQFIPLIWAAVVLIGGYIIIPQLGDFKHSAQAFRNIDWPWLWWLIGGACLTYLFSALTYYCLVLHHVRYARTLFVELAANFVNRLLPAGIGGMGANYRYLRKAQHTAPEASTVVLLNNVLGVVGHALLLVGLLVISPRQVNRPHFSIGSTRWWLLGAALAICVIIGLVLTSRLRQRLRSFILQLLGALNHFKNHPGKLGLALCSSIGVTLSNSLALYGATRALGLTFSLLTILIIFTVALSAATVTPTPGGVGGFEAGLLAALVAYHSSAPIALAAVIVYRLGAYWLPLAISSIAFLFARRRAYF